MTRLLFLLFLVLWPGTVKAQGYDPLAPDMTTEEYEHWQDTVCWLRFLDRPPPTPTIRVPIDSFDVRSWKWEYVPPDTSSGSWDLLARYAKNYSH